MHSDLHSVARAGDRWRSTGIRVRVVSLWYVWFGFGFGGLGYRAPPMAGLPNRQSDVQSLDDWDEYWRRLQEQRQGGGGNFGLA